MSAPDRPAGQSEAWVIAHCDYDSYEVLAIFTDHDQAQKVLDEVDLTPTGKRRGYWQIDAYPLNPVTFKEAEQGIEVDGGL